MIDDSTHRKTPVKEAFEGCLFFLCLISLTCAVILLLVFVLSDIFTNPIKRLTYSAVFATLGAVGAYVGTFQYSAKRVRDKPSEGSRIVSGMSNSSMVGLVFGIAIIGIVAGVSGLWLYTIIGSLRVQYQQLWLVTSLVAILVLGSIGYWWGRSAMEFERKWALLATGWIPFLLLYATVASYLYETYLLTWTVFFAIAIGILYAIFTILAIDWTWDPQRLEPRQHSCLGQFLSSLGGVLFFIAFVPLLVLAAPARKNSDYFVGFGIDREVHVAVSLYFLLVSTYLVSMLWKHRPRYHHYKPHMTREYPVPEPKK